MLGLLKKDLLLIIRTISPIYLVTFLVVIFPIIQNPSFLMPIISLMVGLLFAMQVLSTMSLDEVVKWEKNLTAMPISVRDEVVSKYIFAILLSVFSLIIVSIIGRIAIMFLPISKLVLLFYIILSFVIGLIYNAIVIPSAFKYGSANCKYVLFVFVSLPTIVAFIAKTLKIEINIQNISMSYSLFIASILAFTLLVLAISFKISLYVKRMK